MTRRRTRQDQRMDNPATTSRPGGVVGTQPIATAPRDGRTVRVYRPKKGDWFDMLQGTWERAVWSQQAQDWVQED